MGNGRTWSPGLPPPQLAPCSDTHLAVFVTVQGRTGLAEKGAVPGHVGEAGDDVIKVPGGVGQRAGLRGCSPTRSQVRPGPSLFPSHHSASSSNSAEFIRFLTISKASLMGSFPKGKNEPPLSEIDHERKAVRTLGHQLHPHLLPAGRSAPPHLTSPNQLRIREVIKPPMAV